MLSEEPLALKPMPGSRRHTAVSMLAAARGVTPSGICTFAVKYKLLGRTGYECRAGGGCGAAGRGGVPLEPCRFAQGAPSLVPSLDTVLGVPSDGYAGEDGGMANGGGGDGGSAGGTGHGAGMEVEEAAFTTRQMVGAASMATTAVALDGATAVALKRQQDAAWIGLMGTALRRQVELYKISSGTSKSDEDLWPCGRTSHDQSAGVGSSTSCAVPTVREGGVLYGADGTTSVVSSGPCTV